MQDHQFIAMLAAGQLAVWLAAGPAEAHHAVPAPAKMNSKTGPQPHRLHVQHCSSVGRSPSVQTPASDLAGVREFAACKHARTRKRETRMVAMMLTPATVYA
jgi:hypothetical protein